MYTDSELFWSLKNYQILTIFDSDTINRISDKFTKLFDFHTRSIIYQIIKYIIRKSLE